MQNLTDYGTIYGTVIATGPMTFRDTRGEVDFARYILSKRRAEMVHALVRARGRVYSLRFSQERFLKQPISAVPAAAAIVLHWIRTRCA